MAITGDEPWMDYQPDAQAHVDEPWLDYQGAEPAAAIHQDLLHNPVTTGLERGVAGLAGAPHDLLDLAGRTFGIPMMGMPNTIAKTPGGADLNALFGPQYEPQGAGEKTVEKLAEFAPAAIGGGGLAEALARVGLGAAGSVGAQKLTQAVGGDQTAQDWASILGGGAGIGVGGHLGVTGAARALDRVNPLSRLSADPNAMGMSGGNVRIGPPPAPNPPIDLNLAKRGRMTPEKFDATVAPYNDQGVVPFEFQGYGPRAGVASLEGLSRDANLNVGDKAKEVIDPALDQLQARALTGVARMVSGDASATDAKAAIDKLHASILDKAHEYDPILHDGAVTPALEAKVAPILDKIDDGTMSAIGKESTKLAKSLGYDPTQLNPARTLQFFKQQLWNHAEGLQANPETAQRGGVYKQLWGDLRGALHEGIPGYGEVDQQYSNLLDRANLASHLYDKIAGKITGYDPGNIGRNLVVGDQLRAAFGDDATKHFIAGQSLIHKDAGSFNRIAPDRQSVTASAQSSMQTNLADAMRGTSKSPIDLALHWMNQRVADAIDLVGKGHREALGDQLLSPMTKERQAQFRKHLTDIETRKRAAMLAAALSTRVPPTQQNQGQQ